jgi:phage shock protein A
MAILKTIGGWFRATDRVAAKKIEDANIIEFSTNDLEDIQKDLKTVHENKGRVKARMAQLREDITDLKEQITNNTSKAEQLLGTGKPEAETLATQMCAAVEAMEEKVKIQEAALAQQEKLLAQQETTEASLETALQDCKNELDLMKTEKAVTDANKSLVNVSANSAGSAVEKFKERRRKLKEDLHVSSAMVEETQENSKTLDQKADAMLGKSKGSALLEKLKAKKTA